MKQAPIQHVVLVKSVNPKATLLLQSAVKWLRRLEERREDIPRSFFRGCNPTPLRKKIEAHINRPTP